MSLYELTLTLIRGLPGSGKSTLARSLLNNYLNECAHLEADMFFVNKQGEYEFAPNKLKQAHQWCEQQCELYLQQNINVIVSNTFVKQWELKYYRLLAKKYNAKLIIQTCHGKYKNIHQVPEATIKKMKRQWEV
ncbi:ATP-binding protein [Psychromonas sp. RZ22]|uniref:ATP-binding protein n=1 Tax=Psychromonas algarum TaxID=2555643 RepID=UPI001067AE81|nr:ATP-binding protein [Psychromonas sp. RZ22]TEW55318.1 ATP-binding protein [Psychromonas sp. RZ22]